MNFYNEFDKHAAEWLRNLIKEGLIAEGIVDERPIQEIKPDDLKGFKQAHFFAGIGGWSYALRLAGWPDDRPVWTGSCPCQSFSTAGKREGASDSRHLFPDWFRLIEKCQPPTVFGEQVTGAIGFGWLDAVATDLEANDYAFGSAVLSGFTQGAFHRRQRLWFVADSDLTGRGGSRLEKQPQRPSVGQCLENSGIDLADSESSGGKRNGRAMGKKKEKSESKDEGKFVDGGSKNNSGNVADTDSGRCEERQDQRESVSGLVFGGAKRTNKGINMADPLFERSPGSGGLGEQRNPTPGENREKYRVDDAGGECGVNWEAVEWVECQDGKARPIPLEPGLLPLVDGIPEVVDREGNPHKYSYTNALKGIGNAIIPQVAAEFITAFCDVEDTL